MKGTASHYGSDKSAILTAPSPSDRSSTRPSRILREGEYQFLLRALVGFGGVGGVVDLTQAINGHVRINLRRVETGMTQQSLQTP